MIGIVRLFVGLMALDARGQRAVDATLADWRHELARASTGGRRFLVNVRSTLGVVRTVAKVGWTDFRTGPASPFAWRFAAIAALWAMWMFKDGAPGNTDRFFVVASQAKAWRLVAASLIPQLLAAMPVMIFLAEATGRRDRVTPVAGTVLLLAVVILVIGLVVWPASAVYLKHETWRYFANASVPEPTMSALSLSALSVFPTVLAIAGAWLLFVFANRVRRVGGVAGWGIGLGPVMAVYLLLVLATVLASATLRIPAFRYPVWIVLSLSGPAMLVAAILWATHRLARIEARRDAGLEMVNSQS